MKEMTYKVSVVVPMYRSELTDNERVALDSITGKLGARRIVVVAPKGLDLSEVSCSYPMLERIDFPPEMFDGIRGYNRLMTSPQFYEAFADSEYILIAQLDTYIFADHLEHWTALGYDYVGAPWLERPINRLPVIKQFKRWKDRRRLKRGDYSKTALYGRVGNGGLSLRKVESHLLQCQQDASGLAHLNTLGKKGYPEDVYFATHPQNFKYPTVTEALAFAFDKYPRYSYRLNGGTLPMGCHAWYSRKMRRFWWPIIMGKRQ